MYCRCRHSRKTLQQNKLSGRPDMSGQGSKIVILCFILTDPCPHSGATPHQDARPSQRLLQRAPGAHLTTQLVIMLNICNYCGPPLVPSVIDAAHLHMQNDVVTVEYQVAREVVGPARLEAGQRSERCGQAVRVHDEPPQHSAAPGARRDHKHRHLAPLHLPALSANKKPMSAHDPRSAAVLADLRNMAC